MRHSCKSDSNDEFDQGISCSASHCDYISATHVCPQETPLRDWTRRLPVSTMYLSTMDFLLLITGEGVPCSVPWGIPTYRGVLSVERVCWVMGVLLSYLKRCVECWEGLCVCRSFCCLNDFSQLSVKIKKLIHAPWFSDVCQVRAAIYIEKLNISPER